MGNLANETDTAMMFPIALILNFILTNGIYVVISYYSALSIPHDIILTYFNG